jgi:hypothetical protein
LADFSPKVSCLLGLGIAGACGVVAGIGASLAVYHWQRKHARHLRAVEMTERVFSLRQDLKRLDNGGDGGGLREIILKYRRSGHAGDAAELGEAVAELSRQLDVWLDFILGGFSPPVSPQMMKEASHEALSTATKLETELNSHARFGE